MSDFLDSVSEKVRKSSDHFIDRVKSGVYKKNILTNTEEAFPLEKSSKSFEHFINSEQYRQISTQRP